jgi:hypothetical protein
MVHSCFSPCNKLLYCWQHEGLNPTDFQQLENLSALFQNAPADLTKAQQFLDKLEGNKN